MTISSPRICYVEDDHLVAEPVKLGMETLLAAEVDHFLTADYALSEMKKKGFDHWGIFALDNRSGAENMRGIELAKIIKAEYPQTFVVSLCSSNWAKLGIWKDKSENKGIEFWYKISEAYSMIAWLADCIKESHMISRNDWLEGLNESTNYIMDGFGEERQMEKALRRICMGFRDEIDPELKGILLRKDVKEYLQELTGITRGVERI